MIHRVGPSDVCDGLAVSEAGVPRHIVVFYSLGSSLALRSYLAGAFPGSHPPHD